MTERALAHNTPENVDRLFRDPAYVASYCDRKRIAWYGTIISIFLEEAGIEFAGKSIVDVGCGTGHALKYIYDNHEHGPLYGFDYSGVVLTIAQDLVPAATFHKQDLEEPIKFKFDVIISLQVFEHLHHPEVVLENMRGMLDENGKIFITIPDGPTDRLYGKQHLHSWSLEEFADFTDADILGCLGKRIWAIVGGTK